MHARTCAPACPPSTTAILLNSVVGLVDFEEAIFLLRVEPKDFIVWMLAFCGTLFFGIQVCGLVVISDH